MRLVSVAAIFAVIGLRSDTFAFLRHFGKLPTATVARNAAGREEILRIRGYVLLYFEIIEYFKIGVQILVFIQRLLLLIRRQASVAAQPLPGMITLLGLLPRGLPFFPLLYALEAARLGRARQNYEHQHEAGERCRHFRRDWFEV